MQFEPVGNNVLVKSLNKRKEKVCDGGICYDIENVEKYEILKISLLPDYNRNFPFKVGDIVTCCATGTRIEGTDLRLMNPDYITAKIL